MRILVIGARLVLRALLTDRVDDGGGHELAGRTFQTTVQRVDNLVFVGGFVIQSSLVEIALLDQHVQHGIVLGGCGLLEFLHRTGQQAELLTQLDVAIFEVTGRRRHVMRIDGRQCVRTPILRSAEHTVHLFEPFHGTAENAMFGQRLGHIGRHDTQILADNHATSAGSLKRENAEHDIGIVMHICAISGGLAFRNPP